MGWSARARRVMLPAIAVGSVGAGVLAQFAPAAILDLRAASTAELVGVLALLFLPLMTVSAVVMDRRLRVRRTPHTVAPAPSRITPVEAPVAPIPNAPGVSLAEARDRPSTAPSVPHPPRPRPAIQFVIEPKPQREIITLSVPAHRAA